MSSYDEVKIHRACFINELKNKRRAYYVEVKGVQIVVFPNVLPPTTDSRLMVEHINVPKGSRILDMSTGTGVFAVVAGLQGATGIAVDINPDAVKNANENFRRFNLDMKAIQSDMFQNIPLEKFDFIFCNPPYDEGEITHPLEHAIFGTKKVINELFKKSPYHLKKSGKMLVTFAEWGKIDYFEKKSKESCYKSRILGTKTSIDGKRKYRLYEFTLPKGSTKNMKRKF